MIESLKVTNVALIEEIAIDFAPGLNILTGETGAGKSILIDSIGFVMGHRAGADFIRQGAEAATVEVFFTIENKQTVEKILELGIEIGEDNALLMFRSQSAKGKAACKANGRAVTVGMLREIGALLVDIHGQFEHQSLLSAAVQMQLLDRFCGNDLDEPKKRLGLHIDTYRTLVKRIQSLTVAEPGQADEIKYRINEIQGADLAVNEEETLTQRRKLLANMEKINRSASAAARLLLGDEGALDKLGQAAQHFDIIASLDGSSTGPAEELNALLDQLEDTARDFSRRFDAQEFNPHELEEIEERLHQIYRLKQKYGKKNIAQILEYLDEMAKELERLENSREELTKAQAEKKALEKEIGRACLDLSNLRRRAGRALGAQIQANLRELGMESAQFSVDVVRKSEFGPSGFDRVEFLISPNAGEGPAPLSKIASGGEMSRVMLALKTVLASYDTIESFIFDEIDAGVSGRTAQKVAEKLSIIGGTNQILCITHLPQIAAMGDANFLIEKISKDERTVTTVRRLDKSGVVAEIARLIGGAQITGKTLQAAEEMLVLAGRSNHGI